MFICAHLWSKKGVTVSLAAKFAELSHAYVCSFPSLHCIFAWWDQALRW